VGPRSGLYTYRKPCLPPGFDPRTVQPVRVAIPIELSRHTVVYYCYMYYVYFYFRGPGSSVGIAIGYALDGPGIESRWGEIFRTCPDRPWGPPSLLYNGYRVFPGGRKRPGRDADPSPHSSAEV
jgi:hypothetical protein